MQHRTPEMQEPVDQPTESTPDNRKPFVEPELEPQGNLYERVGDITL